MENLIILSVLITILFVFCVSYVKYEQNTHNLERVITWLILIVIVYATLHFTRIVF